MKTFHKEIANLRKKSKLSREKFASKIGVSAATIFRWENNTSIPDDVLCSFWLERIQKVLK